MNAQEKEPWEIREMVRKDLEEEYGRPPTEEEIDKLNNYLKEFAEFLYYRWRESLKEKNKNETIDPSIK